jgi:protocatechuate 3,4-dioxygenase beta subunit
MAPHEDGEIHDHDRGLSFDLGTLMNRRRALTLFTGAGALTFLAACGAKSVTSAASTAASSSPTTAGSTTTTASSSGSASTSATTAGTTATTAASGTLTAVPEETAGPYPGDGSNGVNVLTESGIVRQDIRSSFGSSTTTAEGVDATVKLTIVDVSTGQPLDGAAVYLWHCDREGNYSLYSNSVKNENYLRGVQAAGADGTVSFTTIFPACYSGRWPHMHYEVYPSVNDATSASNIIATSQLALPEDVCDTVFTTDGYSQSVSNMKQVSLATDNVFRDGAALETPAVTGSVADGYVISLTVAVNA